MLKRDFSERLEAAFSGSGAIKGLANWLYDLLNKLFQETPLHPLKLLLNGSWLEHPLHPLLTDVPVGVWTVAILLEIIALVWNVPGLGLAAAIAIAFGILAALGAIAAGLMDYMDVDPPEKPTGFVHALTNSTSTVLFAVAFVLLWLGNWNVDAASFIISVLAYLLLAFGAYLGGTLVFRLGVMVNRDAYRSGPKDYTPVMALADLQEGQPQRVEVKGQPVMLLRRGDKVDAICAVCSHYGGPLDKGKISGDTVECPWHYSLFSLSDGQVKRGPASAPVPAYDVQVTGGQVSVRQRQ